ncbi:MAG: FeoB-associated Cys-rich membrane protein [Eubacterium sp.]|nr:FeoB-associated Cys-rich membrane protein [Eubacterium sp.]
MGTIVVLAGLTVVVSMIIRGMIRDRKQGKSGCGGDCSRCRGCH